MKRSVLAFVLVLFSINLFALNLKRVKVLPTGAAPKSIVISPDGKTAYSINLEGMSIFAFHTETKKLLWRVKFYATPAWGWSYSKHKKISSYAEKPVEAGFTKGGRFLWVSLHNGAAVVVIDTQFTTKFSGKTMKARLYSGKSRTPRLIYVKKIAVGHTPKVIAVSPDDRFVYVANWHSHTVSVIDANRLMRLKDVRVVRIPRGMAFTKDGKYAYIANMGSIYLSLIDVNNNHKLVKNYRIGANPRHIVLGKNGRYLYVSLNSSGRVVKFDTVSKKIVKQSNYLGRNARTIVLSPDNKYLFVTIYKDNQLAVVDPKTLRLLRKYSTGPHPVGVDVTPDGKEVWVADYSGSTLSIFKILN